MVQWLETEVTAPDDGLSYTPWRKTTSLLLYCMLTWPYEAVILASQCIIKPSLARVTSAERKVGHAHYASMYGHGYDLL